LLPQPELTNQDAFDLYHLYAEQRAPKTSLLGGPALPALGHALAGAAGSAISNTAVYPLDLIITRLQIQRQLHKHGSRPDSERYASIADAARKIYAKEGGLKALYAGVREDTGKSIADAFLFFLAYNFLRQLRISRLDGKAKHLPAMDELSVGFAAGAFSKFLTTPIANIVTRIQTSSMTSESTATASSIARQIRREKGIRGFWSGYSASLILTLNPSLTFFFFETLKRATLPRSSRDHPSPQTTFLLAAVSKALASTITYPFSLAKARAQVSPKSIDEGEDEVKVASKDESTKSSSRSAPSRHAAQKTVFATIAAIAQNEGFGAVYEGLSGEVLKGFFSHGITMLVKESVHKLIIRLYYLGLKVLQRYPETMHAVGQTVESAKSRAQSAAETARTQTQSAASTVAWQAQSTASAVQTQVQDAASSVQTQAQGAASTAATQAQHAADAAKSQTQDALQAAKDGASQAGNSMEHARQRMLQEAGNSTFLNVVRRSGDADKPAGKD
jgi:Mitochondrial carrier protein